MEPYRSGDHANGQEAGFPSCLYGNHTPSMEDIVAATREANSLTGSMISEDIIAVISAVPSISYLSIHCGSFPNSVRTLGYIFALAIGGTLALHFGALRLLSKSRKI